MNLANAIRHTGPLTKFLCVRMVGSPDTDRYDTSQDSPERINEHLSDFSDRSDTNKRTHKLQSDRSGQSWNFYLKTDNYSYDLLQTSVTWSTSSRSTRAS